MNEAEVHMSPWMALAWALLALMGLVGSALCAGGEMGVYSVSRARLRIRSRRGERAAGVLEAELEQTPRVLATLLIGYNLFSYLNSVGVTALLEAQGYGHGSIVSINVVLIAPTLFVIADTMPKEVFRADADRAMHAMAIPLKWLRLILTVTLLLPLTQATARALSGLLGGGGDEGLGSAREKMAVLLKEGARHGVMSESQVSLLDRAFLLREATVGDELVPWGKCALVGLGWDRSRLLAAARAAGHSRFPVVDGAGAVRGIVEALDLALEPDESFERLIRPAVFFGENVSVREALVQLSAEGAAMGIVMAGDGRRPLGIVTAKDLIEPLTGELQAF